MSTIILETDCVICDEMDNVMEACPTEAIHKGAPFPYIDTDECVDCGVCIDMCPHDAIAEDEDD